MTTEPYIEVINVAEIVDAKDPDGRSLAATKKLFPLTRHVIRFDSFGEFVEQAKQPLHPSVTGQGFDNGDRKSRWKAEMKESPWFGTETFEDAVTLWEWGWEDGAKLISSLTEGLIEVTGSLIERPNLYFRDDPGIAVDMVRFLEGEPECWYDFSSDMVEGPSRNIIRMVFNLSASANISTKVMMAKGAAVAAVVILMEMAGYGVQLDIADTYATTYSAVELYVKVKDAGEMVDPLQLAYAIAQPATLRRFSFGVAESLDAERQQAGNILGTYGNPVDCHDQGDLYIGPSSFADLRWREPETAMRWVVRMLKAQGVVLTEKGQEIANAGN